MAAAARTLGSPRRFRWARRARSTGSATLREQRQDRTAAGWPLRLDGDARPPGMPERVLPRLVEEPMTGARTSCSHVSRRVSVTFRGRTPRRRPCPARATCAPRRRRRRAVRRAHLRVQDHRPARRVRRRRRRRAEQLRLTDVATIGVPSDLPDEWRPSEVGARVGGARRSGARRARRSDDRLRARDRRDRDDRPRWRAAAGCRALSLVPDYHLCVVEERQVVGGVPGGDGSRSPPRPPHASPGDLHFRPVRNVGHRALARRGRPRPANA